jgi:hypothetical protein
MATMAEIEAAMDEVLTAEPELTFRDVSSELLKKGVIDLPTLQDPYAHATLFERFKNCKVRASMGRLNRDM